MSGVSIGDIKTKYFDKDGVHLNDDGQFLKILLFYSHVCKTVLVKCKVMCNQLFNK